MEDRLTLQKFAENGSHVFPRVSCYGQYGSQAGNGRQWLKMVENGRKKVHRGYLVGNGFRAFHVVAIEVARQAMAEMVENGGK